MRVTHARSASLLTLVVLAAVFSRSSEAQSRSSTPNPPAPSSPASQVAAPSPASSDHALQNNGASGPSDAEAENSQLKLGPGDLVDVSVYNVPELTTKARVSNAGELYLPLIDYVHVADLTVEEAQKLIQKRLEDGGFVRNPHVTIFIDEYASQGVTLLGEVSKSGIYPVLGERKLYDVISAAGGFTDKAGRNVEITRRDGHQFTVELPRNLSDDPRSNVEILPGDTILVARAAIVYVVGNVNRPTGLLIDNGTLTVMQAIALAGGTGRASKLNAVRLIRKGPNGMTETRIPLDKILRAKAPDPTLQADDILFVPVSGGKVMAGRTIDLATQAASSVGIFAIHP